METRGGLAAQPPWCGGGAAGAAEGLAAVLARGIFGTALREPSKGLSALTHLKTQRGKSFPVTLCGFISAFQPLGEYSVPDPVPGGASWGKGTCSVQLRIQERLLDGPFLALDCAHCYVYI